MIMMIIIIHVYIYIYIYNVDGGGVNMGEGLDLFPGVQTSNPYDTKR